MYWENLPPKIDRAKSYDLERTPDKGKLVGVVTSSSWTGAFTHYFGGRTNACEGEHCEVCKKGVGKRWHGYVGVWNPKSRRHFLFEFTALAAEYFQKYVEIMNTLRGCEFIAERRGVRKNAPVTISCRPANLDGLSLPPEPNIRQALCIIWGLPDDCLEKVDGYAYADRVQPIQAVLDEIAGPAKNSRARQKVSA
jgi:hypothetical protein